MMPSVHSAPGDEAGKAILGQFLGICPLLAVTETVLQGAIIALAFGFVLLLTTATASLLRNWLAAPLHTLFHLMVAAVVAAGAQYALGTFVPALLESMRWYVALLAMNCLVLYHADRVGSRHQPLCAIRDALRVAAGVAVAVVLLAGVREILATGGLFGDWALLRGTAAGAPLVVLPGLPLLRVFGEPAGALLALGLLIAIHEATRHGAIDE